MHIILLGAVVYVLCLLFFRSLVLMCRVIVVVVLVASVFGLCVGMTGCAKHHDDTANTVDAYRAWHDKCAEGTQQWTVTQDEAGQNKAFIVVCSSVPGKPSHLLPDGDL